MALAHPYQIWPATYSAELDPDDPKEKRIVAITACLKRDRESPFEVFNELLAMRLGQLMGLPVPAGMVVETGGHSYFASCHLLSAGGDLPPADFGRFAQERQSDACGVMLFDGWIANSDRHNGNLWYDYYGNEYFVFDHGNALLGSAGKVRLNSEANRLAVLTDGQCLASHLQTLVDFPRWYERILSIPEDAIRNAASEASKVGVESELSRECCNWLISRRLRLPDLFRASVSDFPRATKTLLDPFGEFSHVFPEYCI